MRYFLCLKISNIENILKKRFGSFKYLLYICSCSFLLTHRGCGTKYRHYSGLGGIFVFNIWKLKNFHIFAENYLTGSDLSWLKILINRRNAF
nr:MAG TPA: hypothetical protein [Caudoviricetes sp.]